MGKRNVRIPGNEVLARLKEFEGTIVQLIARNGKTYSGKVEKAEGNSLKVIDGNTFWYNRKKHTHILPAEDIQEIILDQVTEW